MNRKFLHFSFIIFLFSSVALIAQKKDSNTMIFGKTYTKEQVKEMNGVIRCATTEYETFLQKQNPDRMTDAQFEAWLAPFVADAKANKSQNGGIVTIPVVVHVIHNGQAVGTAPNITDNQVISQITVMSQDFRKMSGTPGFNTNAVGADTQIQFELAKVDPNGNPTNGIDRVNLCQASWSTDEIDSKVKPQTIWDPTLYMNMWSVNFTDTSLLGYAQFPSSSGLSGLSSNGGLASTDGVVANYSTFGSVAFDDGTFLLAAPYNRGRTMTHEVGHFLGLRHIWGDTTCGDDYCADTPTAQGANSVCSSPIAGCVAGQFAMTANYMDYTIDTCMNIYTIDQTSRFTAVMNNSPRRASLKTSTKNVAIPLFANDAEIKFENGCNLSPLPCETLPTTFTIKLTNRGTNILSNAIINYTLNGTTQTYNYTGSLAQDKTAIISIPVAASVPSGTITGALTSVNGTTDSRASNNTFSAQFISNGAQNFQFNTVVYKLQRDVYGSETTWDLKNSAGATLFTGGPYTNASSQPLITQTWNLPSNDCYTFTIYDSEDDGICCDYGSGYFSLKSVDGTSTIYEGGSFGSQDVVRFKTSTLSTAESVKPNISIYPNPAQDIINITNVSDRSSYLIYNTAGQIVSSGNIKAGKVYISELVIGNYILKVLDKASEINFKFIKR
ncbi:M43 family zinc metalloprotease [Frigoriflavimonas asaccharolytica]|uniref:Secreted protein (Por secretion system target) n=1 Tax=Frigoriflavimonas asaccharolytica TaxID=2735899 RepID=A0A8J8K6L0_9FLAO|nr:M43 family zinc metalloprotease [Frigoriflavimonas asaccharolytica]NRS93870.1 hypothetical protein [Frigoriflavimonas asaccharolytica]